MGELQGKVQALLERAVDDAVVPRAAVVVVDAGGQQDLMAAGCEPDAMWRWASMTKAVASVAALQLVEEGRIGLETEVREVLPAFGELQVLEGFDEDGTPRLRPPRRQATLRHLLTHTSGLTYFFVNEAMARYHEAAGAPHVLMGVRAGLQTPLVADPGERFEYGISTDWLGVVLEELCGATLDVVLRDRVLEPLGMGETGFRVTPEQRERMCPVHHRLPDGGLLAGEMDLVPEPELWPAGHGLQGTAADYGRFMAMLLRGGELDGARVLRPETVDLLFTDHLQGAPLPEVIRSAVPELTNDIPSLPVPQGWGLGLHLTLADVPGMRRAGTGDWAGLFNSYFWIDRTTGVAAAFFTQVLPFFDHAVVGTALGVEQAVYEAVAAPAA